VGNALSWNSRYENKLISTEAALHNLKSGMRIFLGTACGEPLTLVEALVSGQRHIEDAEIFQLLPLGNAPYLESKYSGRFRHNSFFIGPPLRGAIEEGRADYTPIMLSDIPRLIKQGIIKIDAALICVSPPDSHGYVSLGVSVDIVQTVVQHAATVIAEVNESMPRTLGDCSFHVDQIDHFVKGERPILEFSFSEPTEVQLKVAENVARLVEDGATIETGIGIIPTTVLNFLHDRRDLGVHTEVMLDAIVDLVESGVINNRKKTINQGRSIASFCMGSRKLYDFVHNNPGVAFRPTDYVNDPYVIAQNDKMTGINVALEVDITGQVAADSIGYRFYSGIGGQVDFIRGAGKSKWGRPIICLPSVTGDGSKSRITPFLSEGAGVVTTRGDVHYVVTEYGIAYLHGKSIRERVMSLIQIAHPKYREELLDFAKKHHYVDPETPMPPSYGKVYPAEMEKRTKLIDGTDVLIRPLKPDDEELLKQFFYSLKDQSLYYRFFTPGVRLSRERKEPLKLLDYDLHMAIGAFVGEPGKETIVGVGNYILDPATNTADLAFIVRDDWQHKKLGTMLFNTIAGIAISRDIRGFTAEVLAQNRPMMKILQDSGYVIRTHLEEAVYSISLTFERKMEKKLGDETPLRGA